MVRALWKFQLVRFLGTGAVGAVLYYVVFFSGIGFFGEKHLLAWATVASVVNYVSNFVLQRWFAFDIRVREDLANHAVRYVVLAIGLTILNNILMHFFVASFHLWYVPAQFIAGAILTAVSWLASPLVYATKSPGASS